MAGTADLLGKILRATRNYRVTRKVNSFDRSAGSQCHSVFLLKPNETLANYYFVGLTTVTLPPKLRSLLWSAA